MVQTSKGIIFNAFYLTIFLSTDGPATINVNIYLRTISRIDDVKMVRPGGDTVFWRALDGLHDQQVPATADQLIFVHACRLAAPEVSLAAHAYTVPQSALKSTPPRPLIKIEMCYDNTYFFKRHISLKNFFEYFISSCISYQSTSIPVNTYTKYFSPYSYYLIFMCS